MFVGIDLVFLELACMDLGKVVKEAQGCLKQFISVPG